MPNRPSSLTKATRKPQPAETSAPAPAGAKTSDRIVGLSLRLNEAAHEQLRRMAFEDRRSIHALVIEAINDLFAKRGKPRIL